MTRSELHRYTAAMRYPIAALALLPNLDLADIAGPARVIEGHRIEIAGQRIRLHRNAAPASGQTCRREAVASIRHGPPSPGRSVRALCKLLIYIRFSWNLPSLCPHFMRAEKSADPQKDGYISKSHRHPCNRWASNPGRWHSYRFEGTLCPPCLQIERGRPPLRDQLIACIVHRCTSWIIAP